MSRGSPKNWEYYYKNKMEASFNTWLELVLFDSAINGADFLKISPSEFASYELGSDTEMIYISEYWAPEEDGVPREKLKGMSPDKFHREIMNPWSKKKERYLGKTEKSRKADLRKAYERRFKQTVFPEPDFMEFYNGEKNCEYCGITENLIKELIKNKELKKKHISRGWTLEIDRKEPNKEYHKDNCVWCCYWCNNAKTDEFTYPEFEEVIGPAIKKVWEARLGR